MAQRGGARPGAGRKPGKVSAVKREIADMAKDHAEGALMTLASIMENTAEPAAARVSAANALLDRGFGRPPQAVHMSGADGGPIKVEGIALEFIRPDRPPADR
jgi:hypothetical protein